MYTSGKYILLFLFLFFLFFPHSSFSQQKVDKKAQQLIKAYGQVWDRQNYKEALSIAIRLEKHVSRKLKNEYVLQVICLNDIGRLYSLLDREDEAMKYFRQALAMLDKYSLNGTEYAEILYNMAGSYKNINDFDSALIYALRSAEIHARIGGEESAAYGKVLNRIGRIYLDKGDTRQAVLYVENSLKKLEKAAQENKTEYAEALSNISLAYQDMGMLEKALELQLKGNEFILKEYGKEHFRYASYLITTGDIYIHLQNFEKAFTYTRDGIKIIEALGMQYNSVYAKALNNYGNVYANIGDYQQALQYYEESLKIKDTIAEKKTITYYQTVMDIGNIYLYTGMPDKAFSRLLDYTLAIIELSGKDNLHYVRALNALGGCYYLSGEYQRTVKYFEDGLHIMRNMGLSIHPLTAEILYNYARVCLEMDLTDIALSLGEEALEIINTLYGLNHPAIKKYKNNLAIIHLIEENYAEAVKKYISIIPELITEVSTNFLFMTATERENYWGHIESYKNQSYTILHHFPGIDFNKMNYDLALFTKGLLLNSTIEFGKFIRETGIRNMVNQYEQLQTLRNRINRYYDNPPADTKEEIEKLLEQTGSIERRLLEQAKTLGYYTDNITVSWEDIREHITEESVCIEFIDFSFADKTYYGALVIEKGMDYPSYIPLFEVEELEKIDCGGKKLKEVLLSGTVEELSNLYNNSDIYRLIWEPLFPYIENKTTVFFATSGLLHQLAIEHLPVAEEVYLCDVYTLYRVSSTRKVMAGETPFSIDRKNAVLYGGLDYMLDSKLMLRYAGLYETRNRIPGLNIENLRWEWRYLPGTKREVRAIASILKSRQIRTTVYTDDIGIEESFKILSGGSPHILHIATHGFYFPQESKYIKQTPLFYPQGDRDSTLYRSGLVFAGANNLKERQERGLTDIDDGILTSKEISELDLRNTELVVLSACQTGLGEITGEGVFGLQRAFKKAGAGTLLMSLWAVHDEATQVMMTEFYNSIAAGFSKHEALHQAQQKIKEKTFKLNGITYPGSAPYFWAGFIMLD